MIQNRTSAGREEQPVHSTIEPNEGNYGETFDYKTFEVNKHHQMNM
jgi:hypothetical protein